MAASPRAPRHVSRAGASGSPLNPPPRFERYVALGDSSTEGLMDRDGRGGYVGWSRRLAQCIANAQGGLLYANLGVRGLTTREIRERQLAPALAMRPDLASVFSGTNDVLRFQFDAGVFAADVRALQRELRESGATVITFTLPDLSPLLPWARPLASRILVMNDIVRAACAETGARLVDFAAYPVSTDPRLWDPDRIHANPAGHARIADALAHALGLLDAGDAWKAPLSALPRESAVRSVARELGWAGRYLVPWAVAQMLPTRPSLHDASTRELRPLTPRLSPVTSAEA